MEEQTHVTIDFTFILQMMLQDLLKLQFSSIQEQYSEISLPITHQEMEDTSRSKPLQKPKLSWEEK